MLNLFLFCETKQNSSSTILFFVKQIKSYFSKSKESQVLLFYCFVKCHFLCTKKSSRIDIHPYPELTRSMYLMRDLLFLSLIAVSLLLSVSRNLPRQKQCKTFSERNRMKHPSKWKRDKRSLHCREKNASNVSWFFTCYLDVQKNKEKVTTV